MWLALTRPDGTPILCNSDRIDWMRDAGNLGTALFFVGDQSATYVEESLPTIKKLLGVMGCWGTIEETDISL